jgi:hypothetical protein
MAIAGHAKRQPQENTPPLKHEAGQNRTGWQFRSEPSKAGGGEREKASFHIAILADRLWAGEQNCSDRRAHLC